MNAKQIALVSSTLILALLAISQWVAASNQRQQIASFERYVADLQAELDSQGSNQIDYETQINELRRDLQTSQNRIASLETELASAQEQIDPDMAMFEQQVRERVILELQQAPAQTLTRTELVKHLNNLDPMELGQLMSLHGMYSGFLQRLDVDEARMEVLIDGLGNIIDEQNQRRMEIINEMRSNPDGIESFRREMFAMNGPDAQRDALSFLLTEEELAVYDSFQEDQQANGAFATQSLTLANGSANRTMIFSGQAAPGVQPVQGQNPAVRIISAEPSDN